MTVNWETECKHAEQKLASAEQMNFVLRKDLAAARRERKVILVTKNLAIQELANELAEWKAKAEGYEAALLPFSNAAKNANNWMRSSIKNTDAMDNRNLYMWRALQLLCINNFKAAEACCVPLQPKEPTR